MRPPFGDFNDNIQSIAAARGQSLALWDWDTGDADGNTTAQSEAVYNDVANAKVKNALILEHETERELFDLCFSVQEVLITFPEQRLPTTHWFPSPSNSSRAKVIMYGVFGQMTSVFGFNNFQLVTMAECEGVDPYQAIGVPQQPSVSSLPRSTALPSQLFSVGFLDM
jgi:hypothetical protein